MLFDDIKDILVTKNTQRSLDSYSPFVVSRGLSFISEDVAQYVNEFNQTQELFENKEMHYKLMLRAFPKMKRAPRIDYVKKAPKTEQEACPSQEMMTRREVKQLQEAQKQLVVCSQSRA